MPINLSPEAVAARQRYMEASSTEEQMKSLREYIAAIPKHKGTENLLYGLKKRLSKLQFEQQKKLDKAKKGRSTIISPYSIRKEGAGQIVIIGTTNSGKSSLLKALTGVETEIANYDFTTQLPVIGMMSYEDLKVQMIELPAMFEDMNVGQGNGRQILSVIRNADLILLLIDLATEDPISQMELILRELETTNIRLNAPKLPVNIVKTGQGGIVLIFHGERVDNERKDIVDLLKDRKIPNAVVKIQTNCTINDVMDALNSKIVSKKAIVVANKGDLEGSKENFRILARQFSKQFQILAVSVLKGIGMLNLKQEIFPQIEVVRVYTKEPGQPPSPKPIVLPEGAVVQDVAKKLHNKFFKNFKYAKISRNNGTQIIKKQVGLNYELKDRDIIQFFT